MEQLPPPFFGAAHLLLLAVYQGRAAVVFHLGPAELYLVSPSAVQRVKLPYFSQSVMPEETPLTGREPEGWPVAYRCLVAVGAGVFLPFDPGAGGRGSTRGGAPCGAGSLGWHRGAYLGAAGGQLLPGHRPWPWSPGGGSPGRGLGLVLGGRYAVRVFGLLVRPLLHHWPDLLVFSVLTLLGLVGWYASAGDRDGSLPFLPPLVAYLAAGDAAQSLRLGRRDLLLSRGPSLGVWTWGCFSLGLAGGLVVLCAHMGGTTLAGSHAPRELLAWTLVVVYWAAVANLLGFWVSGAAVLVSSRDLGHLARVFWVERGVLAWSQADEQGTLQGPRLRTGEAYALAVAGPGVVGQFLQGVRRDGQEPFVVRLSAGSSATIACLSPGKEVIAPGRLQVGRLPRLLRGLGLAGLDDTVKPSGAEGLYVVCEVGPESWVLASAPGWAPVLLPFAAPEGLFEVVLPEPKLLEVRLGRQKTWEPVGGRVRLVALPQEVLLAELATNPQGVVE
ncbi:MAG: hypothetical protein RMI39_08075, partial [Thermoanaerobaculum sp.]|nr:hypothetical protein [Thermoanaerobaculum sp.]